jgi:hypothetical protein
MVEKVMPLIRGHERLREEDRTSRRTISDALTVLGERTGLNEHDHAEIRVYPIMPPSGQVVGRVDLVFDAPRREKISIVSLPTAASFRAGCLGSSGRECFEIFRLDGAIVRADATVLLADGATLRAVEVIPSRLPYEPTEIDWRIVHYTVSIAGAEEHCYWRLRDRLRPPYQETVPDLRFLDCSRLRELDLPPLKVIASLLAERDSTLRKVSQQKVADTLRMFGIRIPKPRPRAA